MSAAGEREALYRRTIRVLLLSQVLAGAGVAAGIVVGALLAADMHRTAGAAGLPAALFTHGAAAAALPAEANPGVRGAALGRLLTGTARRLTQLPAADVGAGLVQAP